MFDNPLWRGLETIWNSPKYVFVDEKRLDEVAKEWAKRDFIMPSWDDSENTYDFLEFTGLENSINFCYLDSRHPEGGRYFFDWKNERYEGSYGMAVALRTATERGIPLFNERGFINCESLKKLSKRDIRNIFDKDAKIPLLSRRLYILREIGSGLQNQCKGKFGTIFNLGCWSAFDIKGQKGIINILTSIFPSFFDASYYGDYSNGKIIHFQKRAQLFLMIYQGHALAHPEEYIQIKDYKLLGPPADYELPKLLKHLKILIYAPWLNGKINKREVIKKDSIEEQELRLQTINAMIKLLNRINELREKKITMLELDYKVWSEARDIMAIPHHLTPTIAY